MTDDTEAAVRRCVDSLLVSVIRMSGAADSCDAAPRVMEPKKQPPQARHCHEVSHASDWKHVEIEVAYLGNSIKQNRVPGVFVRSAQRFTNDCNYWRKRFFPLLTKLTIRRKTPSVTLISFVPQDEA